MDTTASDKSLTGKQRAFVAAYLGTAAFNATKAAVIAGYSDRHASEQGYQVLRHPAVAAQISTELSNLALPAEAVLAELTRIAMADWGEGAESPIDVHAKIKALELLGRAHGLFTERVDVSGSMTARVELVGIDISDV